MNFTVKTVILIFVSDAFPRGEHRFHRIADIVQWLEGRKEVLKDVQTSKNCIRPKHNTILSNIPLQEHYSLQIATDLCRLEETLRGEIDKINKNLEYDLDEVISKQLASFQRQKHANQHFNRNVRPKKFNSFQRH